MDDRIWAIIVKLTNKNICPDLPNSRDRYPNWLLARLVLLAALRDRPVGWACRSENWPTHGRPKVLPHPGTVSRRLDRRSFQALLTGLVFHAGRLVTDGGRPATGAAAIDGKALLVREGSTDRDAKSGRAVRGFGIGYRLHAVIDAAKRVVAFAVHPLNVSESPLVEELFASAAVHLAPGTVILADKGYDFNNPYAVAERLGLRFWAIPRRNKSSSRRRGISGEKGRAEAHRLPPNQQRTYEAERVKVERAFSLIGSTAYGLKGLPQWVRGLKRVTTLVTGKLVIHHCHLAISA